MHVLLILSNCVLTSKKFTAGKGGGGIVRSTKYSDSFAEVTCEKHF